MRIVTLNTWKSEGQYRARMIKMIKVLLALDPDVVLLQEVFATDDGEINTATSLAAALSRKCIHAPARHKPRQFEGALRASSSGLAVLVREAALEHHVLTLPAKALDADRIAQLVRLKYYGRSFWLANIHLTHFPDACTLRTEQIICTLTRLTQHCGPDPWFIGGDFNTPPDSPTFECLVQAPWNMLNPFDRQHKVTHIDDAGHSSDLDHVLFSNGPSWRIRQAFLATDAATDHTSRTVSDHAAVVIDVCLTLR